MVTSKRYTGNFHLLCLLASKTVENVYALHVITDWLTHICMLAYHLLITFWTCFFNSSCLGANCPHQQMLASDKRKLNNFVCLKGWIFFFTFIFSSKDKVLPTSSSSGWRFNLSPDEWPTISLTEAAEADCSESNGNSEMTGEFLSMITLAFWVFACECVCGDSADTGPILKLWWK